jgi:hypothetical protein
VKEARPERREEEGCVFIFISETEAGSNQAKQREQSSKSETGCKLTRFGSSRACCRA